MGFDPTPEQQAAIAAFASGQHLSLEAGAGTGKTSTLRLLAAAVPNRGNGSPRTGIYMAYNRSIADEAAREFPGNTLCKTGHAHFMRGLHPAHRERLFGMPRQYGQQQASILGIAGGHRISRDVVYSGRQLARVVMETVGRYARSDALTPEYRHVPRQTRLEDEEAHRTLVGAVLPFARKAWADIEDPAGRLKFEHDYYRKLFQLRDDRLPGDFLFLDEAQDSNGVVIAIVKAHQRDGMRIVAVGDRQQSINGWMGAVDAMDAFSGTKLRLSKSFRFGPSIAAEANKWLTLLDADLRITGHDPVGSTVGALGATDVPDAILTRKNATAISEAMRLMNAGVKVSLVKKVGDDMLRLAKAAQQLKESGYTDHPELCAFTSWGQVQDYCEQDHGGSDLAVFVKLVDEHTPVRIIEAMQALAPEGQGQVTISTAHRAKGMEWNRVQIAGDFEPPPEKDTGLPGEPSLDDLMLAYVAVTRAKKHLDPGGLAFVDRLLASHEREQREFYRGAVIDMERGIGIHRGRYLRDAG